MNKLKLQNITLKKIWQMLLVVIIPVICVTGGSAAPYAVRLPLIYAVGIVFLIVFILSDIKIELNTITVSAAMLVAYIGISVFYSYDSDETLQLLLIYACSFTLLFIDLPRSYFSKILTIIYVISAVIAFSILISAVIDNCMLKYFSFIVNPTHSAEVTRLITKELSSGAYSGFAREKGEAAYIMNIGTAVLMARYFAFGRLAKKDIFMLLAFLFALMLTGKRMLFVVVIVAFCSFMLISQVKNKAFKLLCVFMVALAALFVIMMFVPKVANIFVRFLDQDNLGTMGDRDVLWSYLFMMASAFPVFGAGFGSYTKYAYEHGLRIGGDKWSYNGHNSYLQVFAELGAVGSVIFAVFIISAFVFTLKAIKKFKDEQENLYLCFFSLYFQILMIVFSLTSNPVYTKQVTVLWFFSIGMVIYLCRKTKTPSHLKKHQFERDII